MTNDKCPLCSRLPVLDLTEAVLCEACRIESEKLNSKEDSSERV